MSTEQARQDDPYSLASFELGRLRRFTGPPLEFWNSFLAGTAALSGAAQATLMLGDKETSARWKKLAEWPPTRPPHPAFFRLLPELGEKGAQHETWLQPLNGAPAANSRNFALAIRLHLQKPDELCVAAFLLLDTNEKAAREALVRLQLTADLPSSYQANTVMDQAKSDVEKFASVLDLMVLVNAEKRFIAAALAFCNGLAAKFACDRVSLGWLHHGYLRLQAISRTEKFDRHMAAAQGLETAMEEALDQDDEVIWPAPPESVLISRDHEAFAKSQGIAHICSFPLRHEDSPVAVLSCERQGKPFSPTELQQIRLACDQAIARLADLRARDRWFGSRWEAAARQHLASWMGPEHTWAKVLAVLAATLLALLFFLRLDYRVEGNFILRSDQVAFMTGPFDGYLSEVFVRPGDVVEKGKVLLTLDTNELVLQEAAAQADQNRYLSEAVKARATNGLAEMLFAQALAEEARANLGLVRYRLSQAVIPAPFKSVVMEGDLRQRIGSPVKQGEALVKIGRIDTLYVEAEINERDIHDLQGAIKGEIAFVTQPRLKYPVRIVMIEPAAVPKEAGNIFLVRCAFALKEGEPAPWWRPGMSGLCKLEAAGRRTLFWILTHRTVDFVRMALWW